MKVKSLLALCKLAAVLLLPAIGRSQPVQINKAFFDLHSLVGTWEMVTEKGVLYESWQKLNDTTLSGKGYKVKGNDTVITETMYLVVRNATIMFLPTVEENSYKQVAFSLVEFKDSRYTFENKAHDFPKRVVYNLPRNKVLHAWIEGDLNGQLKRSDYKYVQVL